MFLAASELSLGVGHRLPIAGCRAQALEQGGFSSYGEQAQ